MHIHTHSYNMHVFVIAVSEGCLDFEPSITNVVLADHLYKWEGGENAGGGGGTRGQSGYTQKVWVSLGVCLIPRAHRASSKATRLFLTK